MRIGVLTSSRADFGIYLPLLIELRKDIYFETSLIVFGTHLSQQHGYTLHEIIENGFEPQYVFESVLFGDSPTDIAKTITATFNQFDDFWSNNYQSFDLILCLGDRYEMFAAVASGIPFGIKYCHIHGGETTEGAIDNIYRHSITLASHIHFTATDFFAERVKSLLGKNENIFTAGSLSLDGVEKTSNLSEIEFFEKWKVDLRTPTVLVTVHPETVAFENVESHSNELSRTLIELSEKYQIIITMPNADTNNNLIRSMIEKNLRSLDNFFIFENLGKQNYFTAMKFCSFLLGNTSSGIIEAASFNKYVIDLGERQKGRLISDNVFHANYIFEEIMNCVKKIKNNNYIFTGENIYFKKDVVVNIINILKSL